MNNNVFDGNSAITEEQLEEVVFNYWETGMSWDEIADAVYIPLTELLERPGINDLYNK